PGQTFGLGLISYAVAAGAPPGDVPISFVAAGTSLSDASGAPIPFDTDARNGVIHIRGPAVPEPSSLVLASIGLGTSLLVVLLGRRERSLKKRSPQDHDSPPRIPSDESSRSSPRRLRDIRR